MNISDLDPSEIQPVSAQPAQQIPPQGGLSLSNLNQNDVSLVANNENEYRYGSLPQQLLNVGEGVGEGVIGPGVQLAEKYLTGLGVPNLTPEDQAGRRTAGPIAHDVGQAVGLGGSMLTGFGEGALLTHAGEEAASLAGLSDATGAMAKAARGALSGAVETALLQTSDEIGRRINNPELGMSSALANIGLSGLIGAAIGGPLGAVSSFWSKNNGPLVEQAIQDYKNAASDTVIDQEANAPIEDLRNSDLGSGLAKQKPNAPEIISAAQRNEWPIAEGMISDSKEIQQAEDSLLNGPPTLSSIARRKLYNDAFQSVASDMNEATAIPGETMTETQAGNALKKSWVSKLEAENEPIKQLYSALEPYQQAIPLSTRSTGSIKRTIGSIIGEEGLVPGTERYDFVKTFSDGISNIDNLQKLKNFRTEVNRSAGPLTRDLAQQINTKLNGVEERAIQRFAGTMNTPEAKQTILDLLDQVKQAKGAYSAFKEKLNTVGAAIGKKKVYGPQDFIDFVNEMNPQTLAKRLFNDKNTEFTNYFAKEFPDEMSIMRQYQRGLIREEAMKSGVLNPKSVVKQALGLEPEMQKLLFSPEEIQKVNDAKLYLDSFPKSFNPSGTAHESAFRSFFESPTGAAIANLRDAALQGFIKAFGASVPGAEKEAARIIPLMGDAVKDKEPDANSFKNSIEYAWNAIRGEFGMKRASRSLFDASVPLTAIAMIPEDDKLDRLDKKLKEYQVNPALLDQVGSNLGSYLPNHDIAAKSAAGNAISYLNSIRPSPIKPSPLDDEIEPSDQAKEEYRRALQLAERPLSVISTMKQGRLTPEDIGHLQNLYPSLLDSLRQRVTEEMMAHIGKEKKIPFDQKQNLSMLFGQPMDSSLAPVVIASNQNTFGAANIQQAAGKGPSKTSVSGLSKLNQANRISLTPKDDDE